MESTRDSAKIHMPTDLHSASVDCSLHSFSWGPRSSLHSRCFYKTWLSLSKLGTLYLVPGTWYLVLSTWYLLPGTRYLVPGTWYLVPGTWHLVPGTWYLVPGTWYPVPGTWYQVPRMTVWTKFGRSLDEVWRSVTKCDEVCTKCDEVWEKFGQSLDEVWHSLENDLHEVWTMMTMFG